MDIPVAGCRPEPNMAVRCVDSQAAASAHPQAVAMRAFVQAAYRRVWLWVVASVLAIVPLFFDSISPIWKEDVLAVGPSFGALVSVFFITCIGYIEANRI